MATVSNKNLHTQPNWQRLWVIRLSGRTTKSRWLHLIIAFAARFLPVIRCHKSYYGPSSDECDAVDKTDMASCLSQLNSRFARREIIMIFSDFLTDVESLEPVLQRMRYNNHEVVLFHVLHHHEVAFDFTGMVKFKGLNFRKNISLRLKMCGVSIWLPSMIS